MSRFPRTFHAGLGVLDRYDLLNFSFNNPEGSRESDNVSLNSEEVREIENISTSSEKHEENEKSYEEIHSGTEDEEDGEYEETEKEEDEEDEEDEDEDEDEYEDNFFLNGEPDSISFSFYF